MIEVTVKNLEINPEPREAQGHLFWALSFAEELAAADATAGFPDAVRACPPMVGT